MILGQGNVALDVARILLSPIDVLKVGLMLKSNINEDFLMCSAFIFLSG